MDMLIIALFGVILMGQQWFWMRHTQKLVDKIMSRDYFSYESAQTKPEKNPEMKDQDAPEDLRVMEQYQVS